MEETERISTLISCSLNMKLSPNIYIFCKCRHKRYYITEECKLWCESEAPINCGIRDHFPLKMSYITQKLLPDLIPSHSSLFLLLSCTWSKVKHPIAPQRSSPPTHTSEYVLSLLIPSTIIWRSSRVHENEKYSCCLCSPRIWGSESERRWFMKSTMLDAETVRGKLIRTSSPFVKRVFTLPRLSKETAKHRLTTEKPSVIWCKKRAETKTD